MAFIHNEVGQVVILVQRIGCFTAGGTAELLSLPPHLQIPVLSLNNPNCWLHSWNFLVRGKADCDTLGQYTSAALTSSVVRTQPVKLDWFEVESLDFLISSMNFNT